MTRPPVGVTRAAPVPTQHLAELAWHLFDEAGEDVLLPRERITDRIHATDGQFERAKGYRQAHVAGRAPGLRCSR